MAGTPCRLRSARSARRCGAVAAVCRDGAGGLPQRSDRSDGQSRGAWRTCTLPAALYAGAQRGRPSIPVDVLYAVALNESARGGVPWPWTLNVAGRALYFPDRRSAWLAAEALRRRSFFAFDIGLMQLSWRFHGGELRDAWHALDPETNIRFAAHLLGGLARQKGGLIEAVGYYHSATPHLRAAYVTRFLQHLRRLGRSGEGPNAASPGGTNRPRSQNSGSSPPDSSSNNTIFGSFSSGIE